MKKTILVFGLLAGAIVSLMLVFSIGYMKANKGNLDNGMIWGFSSMLLAFSLIFVAIKSYRDRYQNGVISFGKALLIGLGISVVASFMYAITWLILYKNFYPTFLDDMANASIAQAKTKSEAAVKETVKQMEGIRSWYATWWGLILVTLVEIFPLSVGVSLVAALIMKRKTPKTAV